MIFKNKLETIEEIQERVQSLSCSEYKDTLEHQDAFDELVRYLLGSEFVTLKIPNSIALYLIQKRYNKIRFTLTERLLGRHKAWCSTRLRYNIRKAYKKSNNEINYNMPLDPYVCIMSLCDFILGKKWYVVDPLSPKQINIIIVTEIEYKLQRMRVKIINE